MRHVHNESAKRMFMVDTQRSRLMAATVFIAGCQRAVKGLEWQLNSWSRKMSLSFIIEPEVRMRPYSTIRDLGCSILPYAWKAESQNCIVNSINDIWLVFNRKRCLFLKNMQSIMKIKITKNPPTDIMINILCSPLQSFFFLNHITFHFVNIPYVVIFLLLDINVISNCFHTYKSSDVHKALYISI